MSSFITGAKRLIEPAITLLTIAKAGRQ